MKCKGEYILFLKIGETLSKNDVLYQLYYKIKNSSYVILEFNLLINNNDYINENTFKFYRCQHMESLFN